MPLFRYEVLRGKGGTIEAPSLQEAKFKLVRQKIAVVGVALIGEREMRVRLQKREVLFLTREIARLLHAGLPLFEALSALEEKYRGQKLHLLLLDLCDRVRSGQPLSQGLAAYPHTFDLLYTAMIGNAEKTGTLAASLDELAELLTKQLQIRKQVLSALLYPALLTGFCFVVLGALLFFVVPSLRELFEGRELNPFTHIVFMCSELACKAKGALFGVFAACAAGIGFFAWKKKLSWMIARLPFAQALFAKMAIIRFSRAAASLLEGGLPLLTALPQARSVMRHPVLEPLVVRAEQEVAQGASLSSCFARHPLIPPLVPRMLAIAEQSGQFSFTLQQIAQIYEEEVETTLTRFATMAQPILLLILGGFVGFVLLSVLLPLTDVGSFVN